MIICKYLARLVRMKPPKISHEKAESFQELVPIRSGFQPNNLPAIENLYSFYFKEISKELKIIRNAIQRIEKSEHMLIKWKFAANVIDRLFMLISIFYVFITFLLTILINPNVYYFS